MKTSFEGRIKEITPDYDYLYISSHFFLLPVFLSIYSTRMDVLWIYTSILITSLLRWGNTDNRMYQYIEHNWSKLIFVYIVYSYSVLSSPPEPIELMLLCGVMLSIVALYIVKWYVFLYTKTPRLCVPLQMLLQFYTVILGVALLQ
jgi:hypothetical protein